MKITHLCLAGTITDGWTYQENLISKYHKKLGYDVSIITSVWVYDKNSTIRKSEKTDYFNEDGVHVMRLSIKKDGSFYNRFKRYINVKETLEMLQPDILFIHGCQFLDIFEVIRFLKIHNNVKVFVDNHADYTNSASNWVSKFFLHGIVWRYCAYRIEPFTEKFYGVLPARVDFLRSIYHLPKEKVELLVMGADDDAVIRAREHIEQTRMKYHVLPDEFLIVTGGKIDEAKWQTILLMDAVKKLEGKKAKLIVFGSVVDSLKKEIQSRCDESINYIGWLDSKASDELFAAAELVVFPGRHSVFWEQVAGTGVPMICKYWEGVTHIDVGGNVKFLMEDNTDEIYNSLNEIIDNPLLYDDMKKNAVNKAMKTFSYRDIAKRSILS